MDELTSKDLAFHRIKSARDRLAVAEELFSNGHFLDAASKAYYAIFQAARAALAILSLDSRKHSGVISMFNMNFVKKGTFPREYRKIIAIAQDLCLASDYDDFYLVSQNEVEKLLANARLFVYGVENYLHQYYNQ